ncbi:PASTA domain-containing protein [Cellulosimicrobium marinum]|uniref:PASTA domain-containing protein n=1 Tax=Cellulosimicrobium marinum TaxID=1638992 RepID=UPI001E5CC5E1|nr:PASTA domain-containing protein [Cellulosimicrobium marinum]MCB7136071.1 PASTA domain-containing protein [Cellulosimicrobium marinum]
MTTVVTLSLLGACKVPGDPGSPTAGPTPGPTSTTSPTAEPSTGPADPPGHGGSAGIDVGVTIEPGLSMPRLAERPVAEARRTLDRAGATHVRLVDARHGTTLRTTAPRWTVCSTNPAAGTFVLASAEVVLAAAPEARLCP